MKEIILKEEILIEFCHHTQVQGTVPRWQGEPVLV